MKCTREGRNRRGRRVLGYRDVQRKLRSQRERGMVEGRRAGEWEIEDRTRYREFVMLKARYGQRLTLGSCRWRFSWGGPGKTRSKVGEIDV